MGRNAAIGRTGWVDIAKGLGIVLVVYGHVAMGLTGSGVIPEHGAVADLTKVVYAFHMPLFFFLSGLFFQGSLRRHGPRRLVLSKIDTLVYPFVLWTLLQGSVEVLSSRYTNGHYTWAELPSLLWHPGSQMWFLYALFEFFLVFSLFSATRIARIRVVVLAACCAAYILVPGPLDQIPPVRYLVEQALFFALGVVSTESFPVGKLSRPWMLGLLTLAFLAGSRLRLADATGFREREIGTLGLATVGILLVAGLSHLLSRTRFHRLEQLGAASMPIYLLHILVAGATRVFLSKVCGIHDPALHLILGIAAGIAIPIAVVRIAGKPGNLLFSLPLTRRWG